VEINEEYWEEHKKNLDLSDEIIPQKESLILGMRMKISGFIQAKRLGNASRCWE
jgi:hypothetical protein